MSPATVQLIIALLPLAEKLAFQIGGKVVELDTKDITDPDELITMIEDSKSQNWPRLKFSNPKQEGLS